jgi:putative toxin-antitoxin system antitoxin component (TIGR02293 family)
MTIDAAKVANIMGGRRVLHHHISTLADLRAVVEKGLPVAALNQTARYVSSSPGAASRLKEQLIPRATLSRRTRPKLGKSERVERIARIMALVEHVWEGRQDRQSFLHEPDPCSTKRPP